MAVKTKDELLSSINELEGIEDDRLIGLLEDIGDTFDSFSDGENWKKKYEENDAQWKQKYRDRFFNNTKDEPEELKPEEPKVLTFESLFKTD